MSGAATAHIRRNLTEIADLPPPTETWIFRNVDTDESTFQSLEEDSLIDEAGQEDTGETTVTVRRTTRDAWNVLQRYVDD